MHDPSSSSSLPFRSTLPLIPAPPSRLRTAPSSAQPQTPAQSLYPHIFSGGETGTATHTSYMSSSHMEPSTGLSSSSSSSTSSLYGSSEAAARGEPDPSVSRSQILSGALAVTLSFLATALLVGWLKAYRGGFSLQDGERFNLHPLCMVLAIALLLTNGILAWRLWPLSHGARKALHVFFNASALALVGLGLYMVYSALGPPHNYSVHSWLGLATALLLALQALGGLLYLLPTSGSSKRAVLPSHAWFGLAVYTLAMLTLVTGVVNLFALLSTMSGGSGGGNDVWSHLSPLQQQSSSSTKQLVPNSRESVVSSLLGLTLFALLLSVLHAVMPRRTNDAGGGGGGGGGASAARGAGASSGLRGGAGPDPSGSWGGLGGGTGGGSSSTSLESRPIAARFPMYSS